MNMGKQLEPAQVRLRVAAFAGIMLGALGLRAIDPVGLSWIPFRTSCGATTGLPCLFCGMTRALHHLLNVDWPQALYFNWLAFPVGAAVLIGATLLAAEMLSRRRIRFPVPTLRFTPRFVASAGVLLLALWILQVSLAVSQSKRELLNPNGALYELLVR